MDCPKKNSVVLRFLICFSLCLLFSLSAKSQNDVRSGMKIEDALLVTRNCIHEATGIAIKKIRPGDKLEFLGITDELRLDALRRYIVRNTQIGVQSIWAVHKQTKLVQHYIISNTALDKTSKTSTVESLAKTISSSAGVPLLPFGKTAQIVADCRKLSIDKSDELSTSTIINIRGEITTDANITKFAECIYTNDKKGIPSAKITDPTGDIYAYTIARSIINGKVIEKIIKSNSTYATLITFISENAQAPLSPELSASVLVVNAIFSVRSGDNSNYIISQKPNADLSSFILSDIFAKNNPKIKEDYSLNDLQIDPADLKTKLINILGEKTEYETASGKGSYGRIIASKNKQVSSKEIETINIGDLKEIKGNTTVGKIIDIVTEILIKQVNQSN